MWLNKTQRHFRLTPRCSNMDEWKWWRLRWPSMEFNIAQLLQNVIWYVIIWTGCNTFQGYSVSVCEFNENPVTRPETRRESGERRLSSEPSLFFVRSTVKQSVRNSCSVEKKNKKGEEGSVSTLHAKLWHFRFKHSGSERILHSSGVRTDSCVITQVDGE